MQNRKSPKEIYRERAPLHGFGTDDIRHGLRFHAGDVMLEKALAQHNPKHSLSWLVFDVDSPSAVPDVLDGPFPPPNIIACNPANGHAHMFYGLEVPVHNYSGSSPDALRYFGSVDIALTRAIGGDPNYGKLISKNPLHRSWIILVPRVDLYDLAELSSWLDMTPYKDKRKNLPGIGLGRNCTLFESLRRWAYRERRKEQEYLSHDFFLHACMNKGYAVNAQFTPPLPHSEVRSTSRSVAQWTWQKMSARGFKRWGDERRKRAAAANRARGEDMRARVVEVRQQCPDIAQADIATMLGVTQKTVSKHLKAHAESAPGNQSVTRVISDKSPDYARVISDKAPNYTGVISDKGTPSALSDNPTRSSKAPRARLTENVIPFTWTPQPVGAEPVAEYMSAGGRVYGVQS